MDPILDALPPGLWTATIAPEDAALRLGSALALSGVIGFERELKGRSAGLRTHMMVGLASALFVLLAFELFGWVSQRDDPATADPLRVIEAVTAGVAFLAAGAIFRAGDSIRGLTTGAGLWLAGAVGAACGVGVIGLAALATALALLVLRLMRLLE